MAEWDCCQTPSSLSRCREPFLCPEAMPFHNAVLIVTSAVSVRAGGCQARHPPRL